MLKGTLDHVIGALLVNVGAMLSKAPYTVLEASWFPATSVVFTAYVLLPTWLTSVAFPDCQDPLFNLNMVESQPDNVSVTDQFK